MEGLAVMKVMLSLAVGGWIFGAIAGALGKKQIAVLIETGATLTALGLVVGLVASSISKANKILGQ